MTPIDSDIPYANLGPDQILDAVESIGLRTNGRFLALNSYENRVYQIGLEDAEPVVVKFYRPGRWTTDCILEEHEFSLALSAQEIPVISPTQDDHGNTSHEYLGYRFAVFPRKGGRWPELDIPENLEWLGRFLARIHTVGSRMRFAHRPRLNVASYGQASLVFILEHDFVPDYMRVNYEQTATQLLNEIETTFDTWSPYNMISLHGDCHPGNILWTDSGPHFVDLDDCLTGPAIQDLWMLLSGEAHEMEAQLQHLMRGYLEFRDFDPIELNLVEALRGLRLIHYSGWLAKRWHDPAFPHSFPWFNTPRYWEEQLNTLREQSERMRLPALKFKY